MSAEIIKGPFWSNCFLEAAKAKIRHPFKVKVTVVPRSEARCPHFLWSDGRYDYDFGVERRLVGAQILLFRGYIRRRRLGFNQKYKERMRKAWRRRAGGRGGRMTNADKIRAMSDEELASEMNQRSISTICDIVCQGDCKAIATFNKTSGEVCKKIIMKWLKKPAEEAIHDARRSDCSF